MNATSPALDASPLACTVAAPPSVPPQVGPLRVGSVVAGRYEITGLLGSGGMNAVYEARDVELQRRVAIKAPLFPIYAPALVSEARALAALRSPQFPTLYSLERTEDGVVLAVMERLVGVTLDRELDEAGPTMPVDDAIRLLVQIANALSAAHVAGISHRDLKPANVMLAGSRVVLFDLGLAVAEVTISDEQTIQGSLHYIAPEVVLGEVSRGGGAQVDLYALGVIAYELLTGVRPFTADASANLLASHVCAPVPDVRDLRDDLPPALAQLVTELLAKHPRDRPSSAESVLWQLRAMLEAVERPMRVLVVDDDPFVGRALRASLESAFPRLSVETTTHPESCLSGRDGSLPDILVVDLHMPRCNGIEVCMAVRGRPARYRPAVVAMSAQAEAGDIEVFRNLGVVDFVPKDEGFVRRIGDVIGRMRTREHAPASTRRP